MNSEDPHLAHLPLGCVTFVSTGSSSGSARWISPHCLQYHTGTGVANTLCLLSTQSQSRLFVQSMSLYLMKSGYHVIFFACSMIWSLKAVVFMNHCLAFTTSIGVSQRQHVPTSC